MTDVPDLRSKLGALIDVAVRENQEPGINPPRLTEGRMRVVAVKVGGTTNASSPVIADQFRVRLSGSIPATAR